MRHYPAPTLVVLGLILGLFGQNEEFTFKAEARSAFIWGSDFTGGAVSSTFEDPLTGYLLHKLSYSGIEVISKLGYERVGGGRAGELVNYTTIISNGTSIDVPVQFGGVMIDGRSTSLLSLVKAPKKVGKEEPMNARTISSMHCFKNGFLSRENFFSTDKPKGFIVKSNSAIIISAVVKDPRYHGVRCSKDGCRPTGTTRFYVNVNGKDYVFVWDARSAVYCGE